MGPSFISAMVLFLLFTSALPGPALGFKLKPCETKERVDAMPIPDWQPIAAVAGHEFRKADVCIPIEVRAKWEDHYQAFDHDLYDMNAREAYPGEFWYRKDREEFAIVANGKTFGGPDKLISLSASAEACHHNRGDVCDLWTAFSSADLLLKPLLGSKTGAFLYGYPTVVTADEEVPESVSVMPPAFEFRRSSESYFRPPMVEIENLAVFDADPFRYQDLVRAALHKQPVKKEVTWDHNEAGEGEVTDHKGKLTLEIVFAPVCPGSFQIVQPSPDQKLLFSETSPGTVKIDAQVGSLVNISPEQAAEITWTAPEKEGSEIAYDPRSRKGTRIAITYKGLPKRNSDLGPTAITATLEPEGACDAITASRQVRLFFPRDAQNNPEGLAPNWFYYWSQTSARVGPAKYGALAGACGAPAANRHDGIIGYYRYIHRDREYFICDLGRLPDDFKFTAVKIQTRNPLTITDVTTHGIDTFAIASHHENSHYTHFKDWWFHFQPNPIRPSGGHMMPNYDFDGDFIPDSEETARGLDWKKKYTLQQYDASINVEDEEYLAWLEEGAWVQGSADAQDWAMPGMQWK